MHKPHWIAALFPVSQIDLALWLAVIVKMSLAGAAMALFLSTVRPCGSWVWLGVLGGSYAACGWALDDASYIPMWLDGLIALPLLGIAVCWTLSSRRFVLGAVVVAVAWWSNFYTAFMASVWAVGLLVTLAIIRRIPWRPALARLGVFAVQGVIGIGLSGILLVPVFYAISTGRVLPEARLKPELPSYVAARLLSGTEGVGRSASIGVGMVALFLAAGLPWLSRVPIRTRLALVGAATLLLLSMQFPPTMAAWHGFTTPYGSRFRQAFVMCASLVLLAWFAVGERWSKRAFTAATATVGALGAIAWVGSGRELTSGWTWCMLAATLATGTVLALRGVPRSPRLRQLLAAALALVFVIDSVVTFRIMQEGQAEILPRDTRLAADLVAEIGRNSPGPWPVYRLETSMGNMVNQGMFLGGENVDYYSSMMPGAVVAGAKRLGLPRAASGLVVYPPGDPAIAGMLAVVKPEDATRGSPQAFPMVRVLSHEPSGGKGVFARRNNLVETPVYRTPPFRARVNGGDWKPVGGRLSIAKGDTLELESACRSGEQTHLEVFSRLAVPAYLPGRDSPKWMIGLGVTDLQMTEPGVVRLVAERADLAVEEESLGCLDDASLHRQFAETEVPEISIHGSRISAQWPSPVTGEIVVATIAQPTWNCEVDGATVATRDRAGLLSIPVTRATALECRYTTPKLRTGAGVSAASVLFLVLLSVAARLRRGQGSVQEREQD